MRPAPSLVRPAIFAAEFEKTIPIPREGRANLGWSSEGCSVRSDDNIRISTRMRTLDIVDSPNARVRAKIGPR